MKKKNYLIDKDLRRLQRSVKYYLNSWPLKNIKDVDAYVENHGGDIVGDVFNNISKLDYLLKYGVDYLDIVEELVVEQFEILQEEENGNK